MTAHGEVVRSYEPEEMEPTKKTTILRASAWKCTYG